MLGIIGATGQVGKSLVSLLSHQERDFVILVRDEVRAKSVFGEHECYRHFDFNDPNTFALALEGLSRIFLVINQADNLELFFDQAKTCGVEFFAFISGLGAERRPKEPLGKAELFLEQSGIRFSSLRANWFMQNFLGLFLSDIKRGILRLPVDDSKVSFIDARDLAEAAAILLERPIAGNAHFEITGPRAYSHYEIMSLISHATGHKKTFVQISNEEAKESFSWDEDIIALFQDMQDGYTSIVHNDLEMLLKRPRRTVEQFILEHKHFWQP